MPLNPLPLIGVAGSVASLLGGNSDRRRAREQARGQGEIDTARIALNRQRLQTEFRQFTIQREIQGTRDRGQIFARTNESGVSRGISNRLRAINQNDQNRDISFRQENLDLAQQDLDIQQRQSDFNVENAIDNNQNPNLFETVTSLASGPNINAVRSAFGLR